MAARRFFHLTVQFAVWVQYVACPMEPGTQSIFFASRRFPPIAAAPYRGHAKECDARSGASSAGECLRPGTVNAAILRSLACTLFHFLAAGPAPVLERSDNGRVGHLGCGAWIALARNFDRPTSTPPAKDRSTRQIWPSVPPDLRSGSQSRRNARRGSPE